MSYCYTDVTLDGNVVLNLKAYKAQLALHARLIPRAVNQYFGAILIDISPFD